MQRSIIITAGGIGKRMQSELPKQFIVLQNKPVLLHTLERFYDFDPAAQFIITLPSEWHSYWQEQVQKYHCTIVHQLVDGGAERFDSIKNALEVCTGNHIAVHDGVRPLVSLETIARCFEALTHTKAVVPVLPVKDTLRKGSAQVSHTEDRSSYFLVHTPQCFDALCLKKAYQQAFLPTFTDDASVVEATGIVVQLVQSNEENIKLTTPTDLKVLGAFLEKNS
ncbi:MAG: hypothetical protein RLZZ301_425 [Bacteroidota bacterium]|jgi:2-C-methyl-D-erythritol 4-phosphate cytidylyltransferase